MSTAIDESAIRDAELHAAWQAGDHRAAVLLVRRYQERLFRLGRRTGLCEADAEELAQEVLMAAPYSKFEAREGATYWSWLAAIAKRKAARMLERREGEALPRRCTTPWTGAVRQRLLEAIEDMAATQRDVFVRMSLGFDRQEIAEELGVQSAVVGMRIHRGRQWLRDRGH